LTLWKTPDLKKVKAAWRANPNNNSPDGNDRDNRNGSNSSDNDSDGSEALCNSTIAYLICKGLSVLFMNIDNDKETAQTSNPNTFNCSNPRPSTPFCSLHHYIH